MVIHKIGNATIRIHPPTTTREEVERILKEVQRISWEIWDSLSEEVKRREAVGTPVPDTLGSTELRRGVGT